MSILDTLKNINKDGIYKLTKVQDLVKCGCCSKTIDKNNDLDITHSSHLDCWIHQSCLDSLETCSVCNLKSFHLEQGICSRCMRSQHIRSYGHKPETEYHRVNTKRNKPMISYNSMSRVGIPILHFGVEIEIDHHCEEEDYDNSIVVDGTATASLVGMVGRALKGTNLFYCKSDGSLSDVGVEVVSHPFSWNFWKTYGQNIYDTLFNTLLASGYASSESSETGMHIHISKDSVSKSQLLKLLWFMYESPKFMELIAQRTSSYARMDYRSLIGYQPEFIHKFKTRLKYLSSIAKYKSSDNQDRYSMINLQNSRTIEFRMFNGTLNIQTLSKAIEFIHSLLAYCAQCSIRDIVNKDTEEVRVDKFIQFLSKNQSKYINLCLFLNEEMGLSVQKKNKYFTDARTRLGRKMMYQGFTSDRTTKDYNLDTKGMIL